jgi:hypothetical protein
MSYANAPSAQLLNENPQVQIGKPMYFSNYTQSNGFGGELQINNGMVKNPSPMYEPHTRFAVPMMPNGIDLNAFDNQPIMNHINLGRVEGNDTAFNLIDPTHSQPPEWSYQEDHYFANQFGSEPSLGRDNNMLLVGNNHSTSESQYDTNSIFIG